jgi:hypothetical protein
MKETLSLTEATVSALFKRLASAELSYAVLRNYENFPAFSHDLDVIARKEDLSVWRNCIAELAKEYKWDVVVECHHWGKSNVVHHNIEIFRFYSIQTLAYLQVDLFHGYPLFSLPFMTEDQLLKDTLLDEQGFYRIHPAKENLFRLLQIQRLKSASAPKEKVERYIKKSLDFFETNKSEFNEICNDYFGSDAVHIMEQLRSGKIENYCNSIVKIKLSYLGKALIKNPFNSCACLANRVKDYIHGYYLDPCGIIIKCYAPGEQEKRLLHNILELMKMNNLIYGWQDNTPSDIGFLNFSARAVLERGGIMIQWVDKNQSVLDLENPLHIDNLTFEITCLLIGHHQPLFLSNFWLDNCSESKGI